MLSKKKQGPCSSKAQLPAAKSGREGSFLRRNFQKHSRKGTKDYEAPIKHSLINHKFYASAQQSANQAILCSVNSALSGYSCCFSLQLREVTVLATPAEHLLYYYILSKHRSEANAGRRLIETSLVESIQSRAQAEFASRPVMHFSANVYPIMQKHSLRRREFLRKVASLHTHSSISQPKLWNKELPTLVSVRDREESQLNSSESFELKKLAECIREMFSKQGKDGIINWRGHSSWLADARADPKTERRPPIDCDFSSIQSSKNELRL